jgi:hypothetical protein
MHITLRWEIINNPPKTFNNPLFNPSKVSTLNNASLIVSSNF